MATTFYWIGGEGGGTDPNDLTAVANWATLQDATEVPASTLPTTGDSIVIPVPSPLGGTGTLSDIGHNLSGNAITLDGPGATAQFAGLTLDAASTLTAAAAATTATIELTGPITNAGSIVQATAGDTLAVAVTGTLLNTGVIDATAGTIAIQDGGGGALQNEGTIAVGGGQVTIAPDVTGVGLLLIDGGTLDLEGAASAAATLVFGSGTGVLTLGTAGSFSGGIIGFAPGERIVLAGIDRASLEPVAVNGDFVTLSDGTNSTTLDFAGMGLAMGDFIAGGEGGTTLTIASTAEAVYSAGTSTDFAAAAWSSGVPGPAQAALITSQTATPFAVTVGTSADVASLTMLAGAGTLRVTGDMTVGDGLLVGGGSVDVQIGGSLSVGGPLVLASGGTLTVSGGILSAGVIATPGAFADGTEEPAGTLVMTAGSASAAGGIGLGSVSLLGPASLDAGSGLTAITLDITGGATLTTAALVVLGSADVGGATITDTGTASVGALAVSADASIGVAGLLQATNIGVQTDGVLTVLSLDVTTLTMSTGNVAAGGDATVGIGGSVALTDGARFDVGANLTVGADAGTFLLAQGSLSLGGTLAVAQTMSLDATDTLALAGASNATIGTLLDDGALTLDAAAGMTVGGGLALNGVLAVGSHGTAVVGALSTQGAINVDAESALVVGVGVAETGAAVVAADASATMARLSAPTFDVEGSATIGAGGGGLLTATAIIGAGTLVTAGLTIDTAAAFGITVELNAAAATGTLALTHAEAFGGTVDVQTGGGSATAVFDLKDIAFADASAVFSAATGIASLGTLAPFSVVPSEAAGASWSIAADTGSGTDLSVTFAPVCYAAGTRLATPGGEAAVEALRPGDAVLALEGDAWVARPVRWVGRMTLDLDRHPDGSRAAPIRIRAGAVAPGVPCRDLLVSPDHAVFLDGALFQAQALANGATILREPARGRVTYLHVELDRHAVLLAEGLPAESYLDTGNRGWFAAEAGVRPLFPDLSDIRSWTEDACAPLVLHGPALVAVRQKLLDRAGAAGFRLARDGGLHLLAGGAAVRPSTIDGRIHRFRLPAATRTVRIVSTAAVPAEVEAAGLDARRLGVAIAAVGLYRPWRWEALALDAITAASGLYPAEAESGRVWRWTSGAAELRLPDGADALLLDLDIVAVQPCWAAAVAAQRTAARR